MSNVPTPQNFNSIVPAIPGGKAKVVFQSDMNIPRNISAYADTATTGGVQIVTGTSYTLVLSDQGTLLVFTNASPISVSLDSTLPPNFLVSVLALGGAVTLTPTTGLINGVASVTVPGGSGGWLYFDGTNWFFITSSAAAVTSVFGRIGAVVAQTGDYTVTQVTGAASQVGVQRESYTYATDTGSANAYVVALSPVITSYVAGQEVTFKAANANTTSSTLDAGGGAVTIKKYSGGSSVNLASGDISVGQIMTVKYDGTNWQVVSGSGGGSSFTAGGDLSGTSSSQEVIGILSKLIDGSVPTDGQILQYSSSTGKWEMVVDRPIFPVSGIGGKPSAGQLVGIYTAASAFIFPANFATPNSYGTVGTNPTATATYSIYKNGSLIGNVAISTSGVFTFTTIGGTTYSFAAGDRLTIVAPGSQDATMADVGITLVGTRTATVPSAIGQGIFIWRGTYSGATAYSVNDVVAYTVSGKVQSYICIASTTGNAPTNTSFWNLVAQAGSDGTTSASQIQTESFVYAVDAGSANAFSVTLSPAPNVVDGSVVVFRAANATTAASTLTLPGDTGATGGTAQSIVKQGGTALAAGDVAANQVVMAVWDNTHTKWEMVGGGGGGDTTAKYIVGDSPVPGDLTNAKSWPALYNHPDIPPASPNAMDDEFDAGSFNPGSLWTLFNIGSVTNGVSKSWLGMVSPSNGGSHNWRGIEQTAPATPWEFTAKITDNFDMSGGQLGCGLAMRESATTKLICLQLIPNSNTLPLNITYFNSTTSFAANLLSSVAGFGNGPAYMRIKADGTNIIFSLSADGVNFKQIYSEAKAAHFTTAPDRVGIYVDPFSAASTIGCDWFRRTL